MPSKKEEKLKAVKDKAPIGEPFTSRCMKCKENVTTNVTGHDQWSNGMIVATGQCNTCGTKVQRILGKA